MTKAKESGHLMDAISDKARFLKSKPWVIAIAVFCSILWGSAFPVLKVTYSELGLQADDYSSKVILAGLRFLLAAVLLLIMVYFMDRKAYRLQKSQLKALLVLGIIQTTLQYFFFYNGLAHTSGMKGAILNSSGTFFVVLLAHFFYPDDHLNWRKIFGLIMGFAGIAVINAGPLSLEFTLKGDGFLVLSALTSAIGTILAKNMARGIHPFMLTGGQMLFGSIALILIGLPGFEGQTLDFNFTVWVLFLYSALLSAAAFSLWYSILKYNKAGEISMYRFMIPVAGAFLSSVFIPGESFSLPMLGGLVLVSLGIIAVNMSKHNN